MYSKKYMNQNTICHDFKLSQIVEKVKMQESDSQTQAKQPYPSHLQ